MSEVDSLVEQLASASVNEEEKTVSFAGKGLKLDNELSAEEIVKAIKNCPGMSTLKLEGNTIGVAAARAISKALESQRDFKRALWKDMFTQRTEKEIPQALKFLSNGITTAQSTLVELDLSDNAFGPRGLIGIVPLLESASCYSLTKLRLNNNGLGISGGTMLATSLSKCVANSRKDKRPLQLKVFVCGRNRLENAGATAISMFLKEVGTLECIEMPQNGIYQAGIKQLSEAFACNPNLKVINLEDNNLTVEGAKHIAKCLPQLKKLQIMNFGDCLVRTKGAIALAQSLKSSCPELKEIRLGYNEIGIEGGKEIVEAMGSKKLLEKLNLNGNQFGDEGCKIIKDVMKKLNKNSQLGSLSEDEGGDDEEEEEQQNGEEEEEDDDYEDVDTQDEEDADASDKPSPVHPSPMTRQVTPEEFYANPTVEKLVALGTDADLMKLLPKDPTLDDYLMLFLKISSVIQPGDEKAKLVACKHIDAILSKVFQEYGSDSMTQFNNVFLVSLGFLKGEDKKFRGVVDISGALVVLEHAIRQDYFHKSTRDLLQFFLSRPLTYVTACGKTKHMLMQALYQI